MLARGAEGPEVVALQRTLRQLGWRDVIVDGKFGLYTDCALRQDQKRLGLRPDGLVGPITEQVLKTAVPALGRTAVSVRLPVTFRPQRDNLYAPSTTCNVTSFAMALNLLGVAEPPGKQLEDHLYELINSPAGKAHAAKAFPWAVGKVSLWTVHGMLTWAAEQMGVRSRFTTTGTWGEIQAQLLRRRPVVLSAKFTASGHVVCLSGFGGAPDVLVVDDPWGDWNHGYRSRDGSDRAYSVQELEGIGCKNGQIWVHYFE